MKILLTTMTIAIAILFVIVFHLNSNMNAMYHNENVLREGMNMLSQQVQDNQNTIHIQLPNSDAQIR